MFKRPRQIVGPTVIVRPKSSAIMTKTVLKKLIAGTKVIKGTVSLAKPKFFKGSF